MSNEGLVMNNREMMRHHKESKPTTLLITNYSLLISIKKAF